MKTRALTLLIVGALSVASARAGAEADAIEARLQEELTKRKLPSISVGIVRDGRLDYTKSLGLADRAAKREATPETVYRIGSISKVFTATLLVALRDQGVVRLDDPIAMHLPKGLKLPSDPRGLPEITLRHLATHTSGLPRLPVNLTPRGEDAYGGYTAEALLDGLPRTKLAFPTGAECRYSNLGVGLLGHLLERAAGKPYERLLHELIFDPLEMHQSGVALDEEMKKSFATGYRERATEREAPEWDLGVLAPAGGIASSVNDLAKFLALQMKAGQADVKPIAGGTLTELHTPQRLIGRKWDLAIGLAWHIRKDDSGDFVWHNGRVAGHYGFMAFSPVKRVGVILLTNCSVELDELGVWLLKEAMRSAESQPTSSAAAAPAAPVDENVLKPALQQVADALAKHIVEQPTDAVGDLFHDDFKKQIPVPAIKAVLGKIAKDHGPCRGVASVTRGEDDHQAIVRFRFDGDVTVEAIVEIETAEPARIVTLYFPQ
jgi:D-alanyl-D-alanine-carboxypeptidase/D-alanyl-D-alanine-endopeptidase